MNEGQRLASALEQDLRDDPSGRNLQLYVSQAGKIIFDGVAGIGGTAAPAPDDSFALFSLSKPLLALRLMELADHDPGIIRTPVSALLPEFASNGKAEIQLGDLLCHSICYTSEFHRLDLDISGPKILAAICASGLAGPPRQVVGYSSRNSWIVLAACLTLLTGQDAEQQVLEHIARPLGLASVWFTRRTGTCLGEQPALGRVFAASTPGASDKADAPVFTKFVELDYLKLPRLIDSFCPGTGAYASAHDVGVFFEYLLGVREAPRAAVSLQARELMRQVHRSGLPDRNYYLAGRPGADVAMGYGLVVDGRDFSPLCSELTFGLAGLYNFGCADPASRLVIAANWDTAVEPAAFFSRRARLFRRLREVLGNADQVETGLG